MASYLFFQFLKATMRYLYTEYLVPYFAHSKYIYVSNYHHYFHWILNNLRVRTAFLL